jgi:transposase
MSQKSSVPQAISFVSQVLKRDNRIRDQLVGSRTRLICQMRAFCLEYGVAIRQGAGIFKVDLPRVIADESNDLTPTMRRLLAELFEDLGRLEKRIAEISSENDTSAANSELLDSL